jgi:hypothetical protein
MTAFDDVLHNRSRTPAMPTEASAIDRRNLTYPAALFGPFALATILVPFRGSVGAPAIVVSRSSSLAFDFGTSSDRMTPRLEAGGIVLVGSARWDVEGLGLPGRLEESHGQLRGRFLMTPTTGRPVSLDRRIVAVALADQAGSALPGR